MDAIAEKPLLVFWRNGEIKSIYMDSSESVSSANLKRGLASLLQYRVFDDDVQERDASGLCNVTYHSLGPRTLGKRKTFCEHSALPSRKQHPNPLFGVKLATTRNSTYELTQHLLPSMVRDEEQHKMTLAARPEVGTIVISKRTLELVPDTLNAKTVNADTLKLAVAALQPGFQEMNIELQMEPSTCPTSGCQTVSWRQDFCYLQ